MTHVLFWDIDGTLLTTGRAGVFALEQAAADVLGTRAEFSTLFTSGLTDAEVAGLALRTCGGQATPEAVGAFLRAYERHLPERLHWRRGAVLAGVRETLDDLRRRPGVRSLLLTGNTMAGARAKLTHYGLDGYFSAGAFCSDTCDRAEIARRALALAQELTRGDLAPDRLFVIGDTPSDVRAGQAIGARTVALASGVHSLAELEECGPWLALERLPSPPGLARRLGLPEVQVSPPASPAPR